MTASDLFQAREAYHRHFRMLAELLEGAGVAEPDTRLVELLNVSDEYARQLAKLEAEIRPRRSTLQP
jgi:hypothetical protein